MLWNHRTYLNANAWQRGDEDGPKIPLEDRDVLDELATKVAGADSTQVVSVRVLYIDGSISEYRHA